MQVEVNVLEHDKLLLRGEERWSPPRKANAPWHRRWSAVVRLRGAPQRHAGALSEVRLRRTDDASSRRLSRPGALPTTARGDALPDVYAQTPGSVYRAAIDGLIACGRGNESSLETGLDRERSITDAGRW
jgi:hypothetical protein